VHLAQGCQDKDTYKDGEGSYLLFQDPFSNQTSSVHWMNHWFILGIRLYRR
jgi:hypothetical protein